MSTQTLTLLLLAFICNIFNILRGSGEYLIGFVLMPYSGSPSPFEIVSIADLKARGLKPDSDMRPVVFVVDDENVIADTLVTILCASGYAAFAAYDAESALEMARVIPPELLISDVLMPGMSGVELAIDIQRSVPDCRVLLFSGQAATVDMLDAARGAGHDFALISKPVHPTDLLARIATLDLTSSNEQ